MGGWDEMLRGLEHVACPPKLVVTSMRPGRSLYAKVLQMHAYDLLLRPFREQDAVHAITMAQLAWLDESWAHQDGEQGQAA